MEFLKSVFGENSLNYEDFVKACKDAKLNLVDLSKGEYVSKHKFDDEIASKDDKINELANTLSTREKDIKEINKQLKNAQTDGDKLAELQGKLDTLQAKYDTDTTAMNEKFAKQAYEYAVKDFASSKQFTSKAAKRDFINSMVSKNLKIENGTIIGADDFVKLYSAENEDAFAKEAPKKPAPQIVDSTGGQGLPKPADNSNQFSFNFRGVRPRENEK